MSRHQDFDFLFKIVLIGDSGVGKSNLLSRFVDNTFNVDSKPTIGVQFATKTTNIEGKSIKNQIWDTAGQQRFRAITNAYYRGAVGAIIVFDVTKSKTFENVQKWLNQLRDNAEPNATIMLVGNKIDLAELRQVKTEMVEDFINTNKLYYLQTSAATGANVNQSFAKLIKEIYTKQKVNQSKQQANFNTVPISEKSQKATSSNSHGIEQNTNIPPSISKNDNIKLNNQKGNQKEKKKGCC